jgi:5-methylcytosine-specific restriction endonuclease McrA
MKRINYIGRVFGRLTVLSRIDRKINNRMVCFFNCSCTCGTEKEVRYGNLVNKTTYSCGCLQKEILSKRSKKPKGHASTHAIWNYYLRNAKDRNIEWNLTKNRFVQLISNPCHYCGFENSMFIKMKYGDERSFNGIDRFDNKKGYSIENCVSCCKKCNRGKSDMTPQDFEEWIINVYSNLFEGNL